MRALLDKPHILCHIPVIALLLGSACQHVAKSPKTSKTCTCCALGWLRMGGVSIRAGTHGPHQLFCDENSSLQPACKVWPHRPHRLCHDSDKSSPWYNCNGWLGIKHQVTYLDTNLFDISLNCPSPSLDTSGLFHFVVYWIKLAEHTIFRRCTDWKFENVHFNGMLFWI